MNNSICTLFDNILIDIHKFKSLHSKNIDNKRANLRNNIANCKEKYKKVITQEQNSILDSMAKQLQH